MTVDERANELLCRRELGAEIARTNDALKRLPWWRVFRRRAFKLQLQYFRMLFKAYHYGRCDEQSYLMKLGVG